MTGTLAWGMLTALGIASPAAREAPLLVEWADHARDPKALIGDPVFMRTLYCIDTEWSSCELIVVVIGHPPPC
jgi:hypothetical protein